MKKPPPEAVIPSDRFFAKYLQELSPVNSPDNFSIHLEPQEPSESSFNLNSTLFYREPAPLVSITTTSVNQEPAPLVSIATTSVNQEPAPLVSIATTSVNQEPAPLVSIATISVNQEPAPFDSVTTMTDNQEPTELHVSPTENILDLSVTRTITPTLEITT
ncbi:unnamed protein product [Mytilus coruscus]|uniref:Uncharacterized protein n=1 Tax=Mytilus coruscus TaxID=42192 RepID=A0A6J8A604_MYTCO|nr:unnamed protein product [Mytilus coruscus]